MRASSHAKRNQKRDRKLVEPMRTAIYIEDGLTQFVLTAETEIDKKVLEQLRSGQDIQTYAGSFYNCKGGWIRQDAPYSGSEWVGEYFTRKNEYKDESLIFLMRPKKEPKE